MKLVKYGLTFAALAVLASCSNDNLDAPNVGDQNVTEALAPGTYMNISLSIPSNGGRAGEQYTYENGNGNEYAVKDATLYIFSNNSTDNTPDKCIDVIPLDSYFENPNSSDDNDGITQSKTISEIQVDETIMQDVPGKVYWALVIINGGGLPSKPSKESATDFKEWVKTSQVCTMRDGTFFTMTNALGWEGRPTDENPTHLAKITDANLYHESERAGDTVNIFVQRGVAKVTLSGNAITSGMAATEGETKYYEHVVTSTSGDPADETNISDFITINAWYLDITNQSTYPLLYLGSNDSNNWWSNSANGIEISGDHSWNNPANYLDRFYGINSGTPTYTRMFWGVDPNYSDDYALTQAGTFPGTYPFGHNDNYANTPTSAVKLAGNAAYCLENTFAVAQMHQIQSTRVIIEGTYYPGVDKDNSLQYNNATNTPLVSAQTFVSTISGNRYATIPEALSSKLAKTTSGTYKVSELFGDVTSMDTSTKEDYISFLQTLDLNESSTADVYLYVNGKVYYKVIIRHFNDIELGLTYLGKSPYTLIGEDYYADGLKDNNLLGRYGMVRNNWYEVSVNSILGPGLPIIPPPTDTPDDEPAKLQLDCEIHILDWAKRTQNEQLH